MVQAGPEPAAFISVVGKTARNRPLLGNREVPPSEYIFASAAAATQ